MDKRHLKRIHTIQNLFALSFANTVSDKLPHSDMDLTQQVLLKKEDIDAIIKEYAPKYSLDKIAKIDLAILRLAVYELKYAKQNPQKVVIDEAIELAREYGSEKSYSFINGALASVVRVAASPKSSV